MRLCLALAAAVVLFVPAIVAAAPNPHNALDCLFCHGETPRWGVDSREAVMEAGFYRYEWDDPRLCFNCHKPEENLHPVEIPPGEGNLGTKKPPFMPLGDSPDMKGLVVCTTCHFIHASQADYSLLRGFPGTSEPGGYTERQEFCAHCHGDSLSRRSPHSGDDRACTYCHTSRPSGKDIPKVAQRGGELCNFCHGVLQEGHLAGINPFEGPVDCLTCHGPHLGPEAPSRLKPAYFDHLRGAVTVSPHNRRHLCSLCHVDDKKFALVITDTDLLCQRCHDTPKVVGSSHPLSEIPDNITIPDGWPVRKGKLACLTCHLVGHPEDGAPEMLLRGSPWESRSMQCAACHEPGAFGDFDPHKLVSKLQGCEVCHAKLPVFGKDTARTVTFRASVNLVCLRCHQDIPHPGAAVHTMALDEIEASRVPDYLPLDRYERITCATCHNPHLEEKGEHKLRESLEGMAICGSCHSQ